MSIAVGVCCDFLYYFSFSSISSISSRICLNGNDPNLPTTTNVQEAPVALMYGACWPATHPADEQKKSNHTDPPPLHPSFDGTPSSQQWGSRAQGGAWTESTRVRVNLWFSGFWLIRHIQTWFRVLGAQPRHRGPQTPCFGLSDRPPKNPTSAGGTGGPDAVPTICVLICVATM